MDAARRQQPGQVKRSADTIAQALVLSAKGEEMRKVRGLEPGADDSLTKRISPREPLARTQALLRQSKPFQPLAQAQPAQALQIDEQEKRRHIHSKALDLTQHEYLRKQSLVNAVGCILLVRRSSLHASMG